MSDKSKKESPEPAELSQEQIETNRKNAIEFYKDQNAVLEEQLKYETLQANIQEQKTKAFYFAVQRTAPPPEKGEGSEGESEDKLTEFKESEPTERKLATK